MNPDRIPIGRNAPREVAEPMVLAAVARYAAEQGEGRL